MINKDRLISFGYISRPHGFKGELNILLEREIVSLKRDDFIFIHLQGQYIPYKIVSLKGSQDNPVVSLSFIDSFEKAQKLVGSVVFTDQHALPQESKLSYMGYELIDSKRGSLGKVIDVRELPQQLMLIIKYNGVEKYIPFVDDFVDYISQENQEIWLHLPEGLLDL